MKKYILFMSHSCGEHGLTIHEDIDQVKQEITSVIDFIKENDESELSKKEARINYKNNLALLKDLSDGAFDELSDSTWFEVFEREI